MRTRQWFTFPAVIMLTLASWAGSANAAMTITGTEEAADGNALVHALTGVLNIDGLGDIAHASASLPLKLHVGVNDLRGDSSSPLDVHGPHGDVGSVPEPSAWLLFASGLTGLVLFRKRPNS